jgi:hypothetical protein
MAADVANREAALAQSCSGPDVRGDMLVKDVSESDAYYVVNLMAVIPERTRAAASGAGAS